MSHEKVLPIDDKSQTLDVEDFAKSKEATTNEAGFKDYLRIFSYSDKWDWIFNSLGALAAIASGASLAL